MPTTGTTIEAHRAARRPAAPLAAAAVLAAFAAGAQASEVLIVASSAAAPYRRAEAELISRLAKLGHSARPVLLEEVAKQGAVLPRANAVVGVGTKAASWLRANLSPTVPLVYCMVSDPQELGLNADRRAAGVGTNVPPAAQFKVIAEALPEARTVGMLYRSDSDRGRRLRKAAAAALPKGWRLEAVALDKHASVADGIEALLQRRVDVVWTAPDASVYNVATVRSLLLASVRRKTPVFGFSEAFVRAGALLGITIDPAVQGEQAAALTHRVLTPRPPPASQPVGPRDDRTALHPPPRFGIALNLIVSEKLSIALPETLIRRAARVFRPEGPGGD